MYTRNNPILEICGPTKKGLVLNKPGGILMDALKPTEVDRAKAAGAVDCFIGRRGRLEKNEELVEN